MRICHLIDVESAAFRPIWLEVLRSVVMELGEIEHEVWVIGGREKAETIEHSGLKVAKVFDQKMFRLLRGVGWSVRRELKCGAGFDLVQAWSSRMGKIVAKANVKADYLLTCVNEREMQEIARLIEGVPGAERPKVVTFDEIYGRSLGETSFYIRPAVDMNRIERVDRRAMRMRWGVNDEETKVVAILGDPPGNEDALLGVIGVALAAAAGRDVRAIVSPTHHRLHRAKRVIDDLGRVHQLVISDGLDRPWEVLGGCDIALVMSGEVNAMWAVAAGVGIVGMEAGLGENLLRDGEEALMVKNCNSAQIARQLMRLVDEEGLGESLANSAKKQIMTNAPGVRMRGIYQASAGILADSGELRGKSGPEIAVGSSGVQAPKRA